MNNAIIPDTAISAATRSSDTPVYHVIIFQFIIFVFQCGKVMAGIFIYQYKNVYLCIDKINQQELQ